MEEENAHVKNLGDNYFIHYNYRLSDKDNKMDYQND